MSSGSIFEPEQLDLADIISTLLDKGVVVRGDAMISVADIDLIQLDLGVLLTAVESALRKRPRRGFLAAALGAPELTSERGRLVREADAAGTPAGVVGPGPPLASGSRPAPGVPLGPVAPADRPQAPLRAVAPALPERINVDPDRVENGLARLALTLIEVLRKVLEHQAVRRMEGGSLSEEEVERLGVTLLRLHDRMQELKGIFGLSDEDLEIDLGPLGRLR